MLIPDLGKFFLFFWTGCCYFLFLEMYFRRRTAQFDVSSIKFIGNSINANQEGECSAFNKVRITGVTERSMVVHVR